MLSGDYSGWSKIDVDLMEELLVQHRKVPEVRLPDTEISFTYRYERHIFLSVSQESQISLEEVTALPFSFLPLSHLGCFVDTSSSLSIMSGIMIYMLVVLARITYGIVLVIHLHRNILFQLHHIQ